MKTLVKIALIPILLSSCSTILPQRVISQDCSSKYPILLVHGIAIRDDLLLMDYWGDIPEELLRHGAQVFLAKNGAWNSIQSNARHLKARILEILEETGASKVNIIAHSKGGLDSRYMISQLEMAEQVASLTTISTPHRGSAMADIAMDAAQHETFWVDEFLNGFHQFLWKEKGESLQAGEQLTKDYMINFNQQILDSPLVYYQSYTSVMTSYHPEALWRYFSAILNQIEGPNDGLVSVESAKWGDYKGLILTASPSGLSHKDVIGLGKNKKINFAPEQFYRKLVHQLKNQGF